MPRQRFLTHVAQLLITTIGLAPKAYPVDTSLLPALSARERQAIVAVHDELQRTVGTGFVVGNQDGVTLILTARHCIDGGLIRIRAFEGSNTDAVTVLARSITKDLALLSVRPRHPLPKLDLAPPTYSIERATPVSAIARAENRILQHIGTVLRVGQYSAIDGVDAQYVDVSAYTPNGFSGGPYVVVDPKTGKNLVVGVVTCGNDTTSSGPSINEVHDFLAHSGLEPTAIATGQHQPAHPTASMARRLEPQNSAWTRATEDELLKELFGP